MQRSKTCVNYGRGTATILEVEQAWEEERTYFLTVLNFDLTNPLRKCLMKSFSELKLYYMEVCWFRKSRHSAASVSPNYDFLPSENVLCTLKFLCSA